MSLIEFKNVYKSFGEKEILSGMDLLIEQGETITIIGGSGTGKSVTLRLLLGLMPPSSGAIFFKGKNVSEMKDDELIAMRSKIGMLFQGAALFDSLTVFENVAYPIREHFKYPESEIEKRVLEKLNLVGLENVEDMYPADLSGGMKKRVGLARAIATNPEVVLYDEPTTGLDPTNTHRIGHLICELQKVLHVTSIVVTHDMDSAFAVSNRIALLYNKKIEFVGKTDEVKKSQNEIVKNFIEGKIGD